MLNNKGKAKRKKSKKKKSKKSIEEVIIFWTLILLIAIGFLMVFSASSYSAFYEYDGNRYAIVKKQFAWTVVGIGTMLFVKNFNYHIIRKFTKSIYIIVLFLLLFVLIAPKIGLSSLVPTIKGATRWIHIGPVSIQPSEFAKYATVFSLAYLLDVRRSRMKNIVQGPLFYLAIAGLMAGLVLAQNSLSVAIIIVGSTFVMMLVGGMVFRHFVELGSLGALATIWYIFSTPFRRARFLNFLDPWKDAGGIGYQLIQSLYAIGSGGIFGAGLGQSKQKALYIPEPYNDFIFAVIVEELGFIGGAIIIGLFVVLILAGINVALKAKDMYGTLLAIGIISVIALQLIINVAVVTGSMPVTGIPMPFISYGGTSLVVTMGAMGILLNIARESNVENA